MTVVNIRSKGFFQMKNTLKILGIAALSALITFYFTSCKGAADQPSNDDLSSWKPPTTTETDDESNDNPSSWKPSPITDFMKVDGTGLSNGFRFSGSNIDPWRFDIGAGEIYSQKEFDELIANAIKYTHLRVLRFQLIGRNFEPQIGNYNEAAFKQMDYLLAAASNNNIYVLICLRDYLWSPWPPDAYDPYWYLGGGTKENPNKDAILANEEVKTAYKNFISHVLNRINTVTEIQYKNDPHVFGWEIINEPHDISILKDFYIEFSNYIKSIDTNHMVGVSTSNVYPSWWNPTNKDAWDALKIPQLDFIGIHYYPDYDHTENVWATRLDTFFQDAKSLEKPIIVEEFGYENNVERSKILNFYQKIIQMSFDAGCPGVLQYSWGPPGSNGWGGYGGWNIYTCYTDICDLLKMLAPWDE